MSSLQPLFEKIDCFRVYVPDLAEGVECYHKKLGLPIEWKSDTAVGFLMGDGVGELVIHNEKKLPVETDLKVKDVLVAVESIKKAGGKIITEPFDIKIGKCAVVEDPWGNRVVILDSSKGTFMTDNEGNIIGQEVDHDN